MKIRAFLIIAAILASLMMLSACGDDETSGSNSPEPMETIEKSETAAP